MEILRENQGFIISQRQFTSELLQEFDCSEGEVSSPLDPYFKLQAEQGPPLEDPIIYRHLVSTLNYLTNTRPDLSSVVLCLSRYMQRPCFSHYSVALRVLRYLRTDPSQGIFLSADPSFDLIAFCDADWAVCRDSRRSVSGFFITLGRAPISWKSKKQITISLSSAEEEYRSMRRVTAEITWLVCLLADLSTPLPYQCMFTHIAKLPLILLTIPSFMNGLSTLSWTAMERE
nr:secreted RxLR effector protein 161-like [Nicotiana tomentosiformis]